MRRLARDARGTTAIEYCLIASFISMMIVTGVTNIGHILKGFFDAVLAGFAGG